MVLSSLLQVIQAETVLCNEISGLLEKILAALMARDSEAVHRELSRYQDLAGALAQAEAVRTQIYEQCCDLYKARQAGGMANLVARMEPSLRPCFSSALREFRSAVHRVGSYSRGIAQYSGSQLQTLGSFMVELMPERHSGVYGSDGNRSATSRPVLVDSLS